MAPAAVWEKMNSQTSNESIAPLPSSDKAAWEPISFGGVARFASAPVQRLWLIQLFVAILAAASVLAFFILAWDQSITAAMQNLPNEASIAGGDLVWNGPDPVRLSSTRFLSIVVDSKGTRELGQTADLQLELGAARYSLRSDFGVLQMPYPPGLAIALSRMNFEPWYGAWRPFLLIGLVLSVIAGLLVIWFLLATLYALPVKVIASIKDRDVTLAGSWKLAGAALMPGACVMSGAFFAYTLGLLSLLQFAFAVLVHFVLGWLYVIAAPLRLPATSVASPFGEEKKNPFTPSPPESPVPAKKRNPFAQADEG